MSRRCAFSLVEVVIAVGVFAVAIVAVLGLLPTLARHAADSTDRLTAQHLLDAVRVELCGTVRAQGLDQLAADLPLLAGASAGGGMWVAPRAGAPLRRIASGGGVAGDFFVIEAGRFATGPLAYANGRGVLPVAVRIEWPYHPVGASAPTPVGERHKLTSVLALNP